MLRARKVDQYYNSINSATNKPLLYDLFSTTTNYENVPIFSQIWMPVRKYNATTQKLAETYTYYNVGMSAEQITDLYWTEYGGNYLIGRSEDISIDVSSLMKKVRSIFLKNVGKYMKLIELAGLEWNPLWNVDGVELHQILEEHADEISKDTGSGESFKGQNLKDEHKVSAYDSATKTEWEETHTGQGTTQTPSASSTIGDVTVNSTAGAIPSVSESEASATSSVNVRTHGQITYAVPVNDTAFGTAITGGDTLHTEKHVKQGNIGVTETTTLLNHAREYLSFNVLDEFFRDINKVILIGIYDSIETVPWWYSGQGSGGQTTPEHPDTGRISSVYNSGYDMIQSVELDEYGHVIGLTTGDGVTRVFTPLTESQYENTDPKDQSLYMIYD